MSTWDESVINLSSILNSKKEGHQNLIFTIERTSSKCISTNSGARWILGVYSWIFLFITTRVESWQTGINHLYATINTALFEFCHLKNFTLFGFNMIQKTNILIRRNLKIYYWNDLSGIIETLKSRGLRVGECLTRMGEERIVSF